MKKITQKASKAEFAQPAPKGRAVRRAREEVPVRKEKDDEIIGVRVLDTS